MVFLVFFVCFGCVFWFGLCVCLPVFGCLFPVSLCFFACLSSFTDWCTAHRQQFREQKSITKVLENLPRLDLEGAVTVDQSVGDAIQQELVSVGSTFHDTTQKFSTLVLRAGRTSLPSLRVQDCETPLTQKAFAAGLFDATTSSNLGSSFGQTKIRLEVRSANPDQYDGDFNAEKEWHKHMPTPWDVMQLSPAQALTISCQSCGVQIAPSELRDTYGRSFVIKDLAKINHDCSTLFPQDSKMVHLPRMASIFEEPGFVTPDVPQHQFGAQREYHSAQE